MKIRTIIILSFVIASIITASTSIYVIYGSFGEHMTTDFENQMKDLAVEKSEHIETFLDLNIQSFKLVSSRTKLRSSLSSHLQNPNQADKDSIVSILNDAKDSVSSFKEIFIIDPEGEVIVSTDASLYGLNYSKEDVFLSGIADEQVFYFFEDNELMLYFSGPLIFEDEFLGVVVVVADSEGLKNILCCGTGFDESGHIYLIDQNGGLLYSENKEGFILNTEIDNPNVAECIDDVAKFSSGQSVEIHDEGIIEFTNENNELILGTHSHIGKTKWCVLVETNKDEITKEINETIFEGLYFVLPLDLLLLVLVSFVVSYLISRPIVELTNNVEEITKGGLDIQLEKSNIFEIGKLSDSLNRILASLKLAVLKVGLKKEELELGEVIKAKEDAEAIAKQKTEQLERFAKLSVGRELKMKELKNQIKELEKKLKKKNKR